MRSKGFNMSLIKPASRRFFECFMGRKKKVKHEEMINMTPVELAVKTIEVLKEAQDLISKGFDAFDVTSPVCIFQAMKKTIPGKIFEGPIGEMIEDESDPFAEYCFVIADSLVAFNKHEQER